MVTRANVMVVFFGSGRSSSVVNALNVEAYGWWQRFGFIPLDEADPTNLDLYILTKDIEKTLEERDWL